MEACFAPQNSTFLVVETNQQRNLGFGQTQRRQLQEGLQLLQQEELLQQQQELLLQLSLISLH